ncbi:MAG: tetratricopeptide repeat protein, partial [Comamonadaceae bacterium]|nr:tetratricopeptide repeat protein [Comamonadaceae bacterium]
LLQQAKPGALPLAEQATKLMPGEPAFMDTMSRALAAENRPSEALDWARKAVDKAPDRPEYRLQLARLLIAGGQREKARAELDRLAALGGRFGEQAEVTRLRAGL